MSTVALWFLVTNISGVHYSPPMATINECERVLKVIAKIPDRYQCVQINVAKETK